jgi:hypothetical protein
MRVAIDFQLYGQASQEGMYIVIRSRKLGGYSCCFYSSTFTDINACTPAWKELVSAQEGSFSAFLSRIGIVLD